MSVDKHAKGLVNQGIEIYDGPRLLDLIILNIITGFNLIKNVALIIKNVMVNNNNSPNN